VLVWVASYPRSGNTLSLTVLRDVHGVARLGSALNKRHLGLEATPDDLPRGSALAAPFELPPELEDMENPQLLEELRARPEAYFIKTHRVRDSADEAPALYIVRDGRDALVSYAHYVGDHDLPRFRGLSFERRLAALISDERRHPYGNWSENVISWRSRSAPTTVIRFEDLILDPVDVVARAFDELGVALPPASGELASFEDLHRRRPRIFRRGQTGAWREEMPPPLQRQFTDAHGDEMRKLGYALE
jgi:hypothetical protein